MLSIHVNPTFLFEDHKITSIQAYIQNDGGLWGDNHAIYCLAFYLNKPIYIWSKKKSICLFVGEEFISSQPFQFLYHKDGPNPLNGHYEPIVTHQLQWSQNQFNSTMMTTNSSFNENTKQSLHDRQKQPSSSNIVQQKKLSVVTQP
jgi:1,4-alpha-glucan branching enzyme